MRKSRNPETRLEWQIAVNAANLMLRFEAAREYGLIGPLPAIDADRCRAILADGQEAHGVMPCWPYCRVCGCTDHDPCEEGCEWVELDLCSACAEKDDAA